MLTLFNNEENKPVKVIQISPLEEVQKEIFCLHEDESEWDQDCYEYAIKGFTEEGVTFADAGYETNVSLNDYIIKVSDSYSLPVKSEEIRRLGINLNIQVYTDYTGTVRDLLTSKDIKSKRDMQILAALLGKGQLCIKYGIEYMDGVIECRIDSSEENVNITASDLEVLNKFIERHMPQSMIMNGSDTDRFKINLEYARNSCE